MNNFNEMFPLARMFPLAVMLKGGVCLKLLQIKNLDYDLFEFLNKIIKKTFSNSERYDQDSLICQAAPRSQLVLALGNT